jgi:FAD/FMN-containing dehydrogenase
VTVEDRHTHVILLDGSEIVRYYQAGKWYREWPPARLIPRVPLQLREAVEWAVSPQTRLVTHGLAGGEAFDRAVERRRELMREEARLWALENGDHS